LGGAVTPISDPTTYYQATTVGLKFFDVVKNTGLIMLITTFSTFAFFFIIFRKQLNAVQVDQKKIAAFDPSKAIADRRILKFGLPVLVIVVSIMMAKEFIASATGIRFDNGTIAMTGAFIAILMFKKDVVKVLKKEINWEVIFFFAGLFIVVGALEHNGVIDMIKDQILTITGGKMAVLLFIVTVGSGILSIFIDNVPYNIAMVGAIQGLEASGINVFPLWWGLNAGTSIGGPGSPIGAACNVICLGAAEEDGHHISFGKYLKIGLPLVVINSLIAFLFLAIRYRIWF